MSGIGLATADALSFLLCDALFRQDHNVPVLVLFMRDAPGKASAPISVFALLAFIFIAVRYLKGDYRRRQLFWDETKVTIVALLVTSLPDIGMLLLGRGIYEWRSVLTSWIGLLLLLPVMRQAIRVLMTRVGIWQIPTALIGVGPRSIEVHAALASSLSLGFDVRWIVTQANSIAMPPELANIKLIHSSESIQLAADICREGCEEAIVVAAEDVKLGYSAEVVRRLLEAGLAVAIVPAINRLPLTNMTTNYFFGSDILLMQVRSNVQRFPSHLVKRIFDVIASCFLMAVSIPLFFIIAFAIRRGCPGPITYSQERIGRHGIPFRCIKFRTMVSDADAALQRWSEENPALYREYMRTYKLREDPRITTIGRFLRRTSLDELPQLWNVLRGEMSLVGPRPVVRQELEEHYGPAAQLYIKARPGMTGLWQVSGRSNTSYERRVFLDEWYILNWSFWYDIVILIRTAWIVVTGKGAV